MFTGNADYVRHFYKVDSELKSYWVYSEIEELTTKNILTPILRIEKYNGKSNATDITDYLRLRTATSWSKSEMVTGLRGTGVPHLFYGNRRAGQEKSLLLFYFSNERRTLTIDVFNSFYPFNSTLLLDLLAKHEHTY